MKITLKNIGMLDEAEFEVGDLTIICGENNTGKTYATYSLYGYLDFIKNFSYSIRDKIEQVAEKYINNISIKDCIISIPINDFEKIIKDIVIGIQNIYKTNLPEILAGKEDDFKDSIFREEHYKNSIELFVKNLKTKEGQKKFQSFSYYKIFEISEIDKGFISFNFENSKDTFTEKMKKDIRHRKKNFTLPISMYIFSMVYPKAFILSAERTGASMFQKELDINRNEIVERISKSDAKNIEKTVFSVLNDRYSRYPKPVKDNIYFVRELDEISKKISFIKKEEKRNILYKEIIDLLYKIVGGKYSVSQEGIEFAPKTKQSKIKKKFLIQRASSSVRSLLMLNYYILHEARKGNILMIDEPELNLHPANQILMGRLIALLVNAGIKVFITTHSDYIVRELSNCIMLNSLSDTQVIKLKKQGYNKNHKLESKKVKAYLAENIKEKNTLKSIRVDSKKGIFMETFDRPIDSQNENQGNIFEYILKLGDNNDK